MSEGSIAVLSDAQMGMFQVIRPFDGFEARYNGIAGTIPIAFPGTLDPDAGKEGFSGDLLRGIAVPLGGRLLLQIPTVIDAYTPVLNYAYQLIWRTRNQGDVANAIAAGRQPSAYHLPTEGHGRSEIGNTGKLFFIPGASDVEVFEQTEAVGGASLLDVVQQRYVPKISPSWAPPFLPNGERGVWQQGAYQFTSNSECSGPTWAPLYIDSAGDELSILVYKIDNNNWDFAVADKGFSNTYGTNNGGLPNNPNIGILLSSGTMGS